MNPARSLSRRARRAILVACCSLSLVSLAAAQDWATVPIIEHSVYQGVTGTGASAYSPTAFPVRLRGVVLNRSEDWLDPTAAFLPYTPANLWNLGGQAEFFVQAVNLDGTAWDLDPATAFADFGGTACWMGQNYGNHVWHKDTGFSYTDAEWYAELDRLGFFRPGGPTAGLVRPGDLVEIRARIGLNYKGKMNVNENHTNDAQTAPGESFNWEIVVLQPNFGLPAPAELALAALKDASDMPIFDPTRQAGGERHQATLVKLTDVMLVDPLQWGKNQDAQVTDSLGRTLTVHLGLDDSFTSSAPSGFFDVVGILDQLSETGGRDGYRLLVMSAADVSAVPEPGALLLAAVGLLACAAMAVVRRYRG